ncbi:MAG: hypothetical protein WCG23_10100 [bacterium]
MDKDKENNEIQKAMQPFVEFRKAVSVFDWLPKLNNIFNPSSLNQFQAFNEVNKNLAAGYELTKNFQRITDSIDKIYKIIEAVQKELAERNIDIEIIAELEISELVKLYSLSGKSSLSFTDILEDSLKLFGNVTYEQVVKYLEILSSRKDQIIKNEPKFINFDDISNEDLEFSQKYTESQVVKKLKEYAKGEIKLREEEKTLLRYLKKNKFLSNKELAQRMKYSKRGIEEICAKIRRKFDLDFIEPKNTKRHLLIALAQNIQL